MLEQVNNKILALKKVAGIELTFLSDNTFIINCLILEEKKRKAVILETFYNIRSFDELYTKIPVQTPVALVLNGKGLVQKKVNKISNDLPSDILPGVNTNDYLFQYFEGFEIPEIAIFRKKTAETIIDELAKMKIYVTSLSLAFYDILYIAELINHNGEIQTTQYNLNFTDNRIQQYKLTSAEEMKILVKPEINVATEYVKSNFIPAYAAAIKLLSGGFENNNTIHLNSIIENQKKISQKSLLKFYSLSVLFSFLLLLLLNFFIFSHYYSKNNELLSNNQYSLQQITIFDSLKKTQSAKKDFLTSAGWSNDSRMISFYADRIASTVPDSVTLTSMNIYPAVSKFTFSSKQWSFQQDTILISGLCGDPSVLDAWIKAMSDIKNVQESRINSYIYKKQGETGIFIAEVLTK